MAFDIHDDAFVTLFSGVTADTYANTNLVPEPGALWLVLLAAGGMGIARCASRNTAPIAVNSVTRVAA